MSAPKGWHSRGYLPHFDSPETIRHVVFRTAGSLPAGLMDALPEDAALRRRLIDAQLDLCEGATPLKDGQAAEIVAKSLLHFDSAKYRLYAWCVMPNHVHVVLEVLAAFQLGAIVRSWKSFSAAQISHAGGRNGPFWAKDYFDRYMRSEADLMRTIAYVEQNPVKAGLVGEPAAWPWSSARQRA